MFSVTSTVIGLKARVPWNASSRCCRYRDSSCAAVSSLCVTCSFSVCHLEMRRYSGCLGTGAAGFQDQPSVHWNMWASSQAITRLAAAMNMLKIMVHRPAPSIIPGTWPSINCIAVRDGHRQQPRSRCRSKEKRHQGSHLISHSQAGPFRPTGMAVGQFRAVPVGRPQWSRSRITAWPGPARPGVCEQNAEVGRAGDQHDAGQQPELESQQ